MIPLKDENPTRSTAYVTIALIAACVLVYFFVQPRGQTAGVDNAQAESCRTFDFNLHNAAIPYELVHQRPLSETEAETLKQAVDCPVSFDHQDSFPNKSIYLAVLYSMFLHGGLIHLGGNMLYLWIFGNNIEDQAGKVKFVLFYLLSGLAATVAHVALNRDSPVPIVGASGAIAGVMGAYLVLFPNARIRSLLTLGIFIMFRDIPAKWLLGFWFVSQFFINPNSGVAWGAHVGGFAFGVVAALLWKASGRGRQVVRPAYFPY